MDLADSGSLDDSASTIDLNKRPSNNSGPKPKLEILDDFKIESELGHGGMGEVYLATERGLNRQVALKVLPAANRISSRQVQRFLLEAKAAAQLSHDHIVPIYHVGECGGVHYFTMRYIEGYDLAQIIRSGQRAMRELTEGSIDTQSPSDYKPKSKSGKSGESTAKDRADSTHGLIDFSTSSFVGSLRSTGSRSAHKLAVSVALIGQAVAEALQHAHEHGIVHRDIKPSNLMLDNSNKVWVTDFGLAQLQDAPGLTSTGEILGTLRYMSPEQASARPAFIDHRTDIYSLGVTLYELATLQKACRGESAQEILRSITFERPQPIRKINPKLPRDLETIIFKATERNPSDRYQSAAEMAADLRRFANSESLMARRPSRLKGIRNWIWDRPAVSAMALGMLLVFAGAMFAVAMANQGKYAVEKLRAEEAEAALTIGEGQRLQSQALLHSGDSAGLAVVEAIAGAKAAPSPAANLALMTAVDGNHELRTMVLDFVYPGRCVVSADGTHAVLCVNPLGSGKSKQQAIIIELKSGKQVGVLAGEQPVVSAAYIDSDRLLLTCSSYVASPAAEARQAAAEVIKVWDARSQKLIKSFPTNGVVHISSDNYSRVNQQLVLPTGDGSATIYNLDGFKQVMVLPKLHEQPIIDCKFSEDGSKIFTWSSDRMAIVWDSKTGKDLMKISFDCKDPLATKIYFNSNSQVVCISGDSGTRFIACTGESKDWHRNEQLAGIGKGNESVYLFGRNRKSVMAVNTSSNTIVSEFNFGEFIVDMTVLGDDRYLAAIHDELVAICDMHSGKIVARLQGHTDYIQSIAPVAKENELISLAWDGTLRHWHVQSDLERRMLPSTFETYSPTIVAQSKDGRKALTGTVRVDETCAIDLGKLSKTTSRFEGHVLIQLADGQVLTTTKEGVSQWELATQRKTAFVNLETSYPKAVDQAIEVPNSSVVALLSSAGEIYMWNRITNQLIRSTGESEHAFSMTLDHSHKNLLYASTSGELVSIALPDGQRKVLTVFRASPLHLDLHPTRNELIVACRSASPLVWNMDRSEVSSPIKVADKAGQAIFVSDDRVVVVATPDKVILCSAVDETLSDTLEVKQVRDLAWNPDRSQVAIAASSGVYFWDLSTNVKIQILETPCKLVRFAAGKLIVATDAYAPVDNSQATTSIPSQLIVWDCSSRKSETSIPVDQHITRVVSVNHPEEVLVSGYTFGVDCVDIDANRLIAKAMGHMQPLVQASFLDDDDAVLTVSRSGQILISSLSSGKRTVLGTHDYPIVHAAVSPDRKLLLTSDQVQGMRYWDLANKKLIKEIKTAGKQVSRIDFNAASTVAFAVLNKDSVKVIDLRTGTESDLPVEEGVRDVAISIDGQTLLVATGMEDLYPAHPVYTQLEQPQEASRIVRVVDLVNSKHRDLQLDGLPVHCVFLENGQKFAALSTLGTVDLVETVSLKKVAKIKTDRRIMQLLDAPPESAWLFTAAKKQVAAWSPVDGSLMLDIPLRIDEGEAALRFPRSAIRQTRGQYYLLYSQQRFIKQPVNPLEYAEKIAPRKLTNEERLKLLSSSTSH